MISGRRFLSSLRAAKEHGYHSDYIGQLIRSGKVRGQKVGRAWYVDAESLAIYLGKSTVSSPGLTPSAPTFAQPDSPDERTGHPVEGPEGAREESAAELLKEVDAEANTKDPEEHKVEIVKVSDAPEPTIKISIQKKEEEKKKTGLVYISDDAPLLPEIHKERNVSRLVVPTISDEPALKIIPDDRGPEMSLSPSYARQGLLLVGLGVFVLLLVTAASSLFVRTLSVGSAQSASIQFSLPE